MKKLEQFKEKRQLYYIAGLQHSPNTYYTLALGWNDLHRLMELSIDPTHNIHRFVSTSQYTSASVHTSIQNVLNSFNDILIGLDGNDRNNKGTIILSSPKPDFSEDVRIEVECRSSIVIAECKHLGIWED